MLDPTQEKFLLSVGQEDGFQDARFAACFGPLFNENFRFLQTFRFAVGFGHLLRDFFHDEAK